MSRLVEQADGKIVATVGATLGGPLDFHLVRFNADGALDTTFGSGGNVVTDLAGRDDRITTLLLQPDGAIIAVGTSHQLLGVGNSPIVLARYLPNGSLDPTFGAAGIAEDLAMTGQAAYAATLQPDGKIVVTTSAHLATSTSVDFGVLRYNPDGSRDTGFGTGGLTAVNISSAPTPNDFPVAVAVQPDGAIVVAGHFVQPGPQNDVAVARFTAGGTLDPTFGSGGVAIYAADLRTNAVSSVAVQPNGAILVAGFVVASPTSYDQQLIRFTANGTLDPTFGTGGVVETDLGGFDSVTDLAILPNGRIITAGQGSTPQALTLVRYLESGSIDSSFGTAGIVRTTFADGDPIASAFVRQSNGGLVIGGSIIDAPPRDMLLVRYTDAPHGTTVQAGSGTWSFDGTGDGTFTFHAQPTTIFGMPVDLGTTVGALSFDGTLSDYTGSGWADDGAASGPNLAMDLKGIVTCSTPGCASGPLPLIFDTISHTGSALPDGPIYRFVGTATANVTSGRFDGTFVLEATLPANTPAGTNVTVAGPSMTLTFSNVALPGQTTISQITRPPIPLPANFTIAGSVASANLLVTTDATFTGAVTICFDARPYSSTIWGGVRLIHIVHRHLEFVPIVLDYDHLKWCGQVDSFSPFILVTDGPDAQGFLPAPGAETTCATKLHTAASKLGRGLFRCRGKQLGAAQLNRPFAAAECEGKARLAYDNAAARLSGCAACTLSNREDIKNSITRAVSSLTAGIYCDGSTPLAANDPARIPADAFVAKCEAQFNKQASTLFGTYVRCLTKSAIARTSDSQCENAAKAKYLRVVPALRGCSCGAANDEAVGNQIDQLVDREINPLVYCAGGTAFP